MYTAVAIIKDKDDSVLSSKNIAGVTKSDLVDAADHYLHFIKTDNDKAFVVDLENIFYHGITDTYVVHHVGDDEVCLQCVGGKFILRVSEGQQKQVGVVLVTREDEEFEYSLNELINTFDFSGDKDYGIE